MPTVATRTDPDLRLDPENFQGFYIYIAVLEAIGLGLLLLIDSTP